MGARLSSILRRHRQTETVDIIQYFGAGKHQVSISLSGTKQELLRDIQKEMRIAAGAQNLYLVTKDRKTKALVKKQRSSSENRLKALYSSLLKLNEEIARREAETAPAAVAETTSHASQQNLPAEEVSAPEVQIVSEPATDSSPQQHEESAEEPVPEVEEVPEEPLESETCVDDSPTPPDDEAEGFPLAVTKEPQVLQSPNYTLRDFSQLGFLGEGGFAKVLLVQHVETKKAYALKILKKEKITTSRRIERILVEKRVAFTAAVHPFIVDLHATFQSEYHLFFLMEHVTGGCLTTHLRREGAFQQRRATFYAACTLMAISYLHENDIIHRDVKPDNLLLDGSGYIKLADFGLCKDGIGYEGRTTSLVGSFGYMAPEVLAREPYSKSVDWWSLGIVIYEMLVGERPSVRPSTGFVCPTFLARDAANLLLGLLQNDPEKRLGSSEEDACDLMYHCFFRGIDWLALLERKVQPSLIPEDVSLSEDEQQHLVLTPPSGGSLAMENEIDEAFRNFDYTAT